LFATDILKVIYAPHKAFKGIIQNPKYFGPTLIVILFIAASMGSTYAFMSKTYVERTLPDGKLLDEWTENRTLWIPSAAVTESNDSVSGGYYGNRSIAFSTTNNTEVWAQLEDIGPADCSGPHGFGKLSFRVKWTSPGTNPENVDIRLFSTSQLDYFSYNLTEVFSSFNYNVWNNITVSLASDGWSNSSSSASWSNITGLRLKFTWADSSNITALVDGLFFRGYFEYNLESLNVPVMVEVAIVAFTQILFPWVILTGLIYLMGRGLGGKLVWKPVLVVIGFTLVTMVIQTMIVAIAYSSSQNVYYSLELFGGASGEKEAALNTFLEQIWLISQIMRYTQVAVYVWTIALCSLAVHFLTGFSWAKSFLIGAAAYLITLLAGSFLLGS
jgi:hypothetical protein